ncbi:MAG: MFS transporter, partial [Janthinobacterium sp.]
MQPPSTSAPPEQQTITLPMRGALASLSLAMLLPALGTSIANVGLPDMARALHAPFQDVQWIVLSYLLAITALIVSVGRLGDMVGRRRLLLAGIALFAAASILCALAPSLWLLVAARALQGLGASVMMALTMAFVGSTVPKARTGSAMGLLGSMSAVGTTLGPALGGLLIARFGWQAIFLVNVPLAGMALLLAWRYLPADRRSANAKRPVFDHRGTVLLALTLAAYALAMTLGRGHFGVGNVALLLAACVGAIVFVRVELKAPAPLIRLAMLRAPVLGAGLATSMLVSTVMMSTLVVGPFYLARGLGLGAAATGMVLAAGPLVAAFCGVPSGWLVDRYGARRMGGAGLGGAAAACLALALLPASLGI